MTVLHGPQQSSMTWLPHPALVLKRVLLACVVLVLVSCSGVAGDDFDSDEEDEAIDVHDVSTGVLPVADATVRQLRPFESDGSHTSLRALKSRIEAHLRFVVPEGGPVTKATLRMYVSAGSVDAADVYIAQGTDWSEGDVNWNTRPAAGALFTAIGVAAPGKWIDVDVTSLVRRGGSFGLVFRGRSNDGVSFASRDSSAPPRLILETSRRDAGSSVGATDAGTFATDAGLDAGIDAGIGVPVDAGIDAGIGGPVDAGIDAGIGGLVDAGRIDAGVGGPVDAGRVDAGIGSPVDAGRTDAGIGGAVDAGRTDAGVGLDAGRTDAGIGGPVDAGRIDAGVGGPVDAGRTDAGTTYYVSPSGSDFNSGTSLSSPLQTITRALSLARTAGDTIYVRGGTYNELVRVNQNNITLSAYQNERPIIDGRSNLPGADWSALVELNGSGNTFAGFEVANSNYNCAFAGGMGINSYGHRNIGTSWTSCG